MLQQRVEQWNAEILERGRKEGHREGHKEGHKEGLAQARREMAAALLQRTALDDAAVADLTGLSRELIRALRNKPTEHECLVSPKAAR